MAAAFFNALVDPQLGRALSAGTRPAKRLHPEVITVMREVGIELDGVAPRMLTPELISGVELVVTMGCGDECPVPPRLLEDWPVADPKNAPLGTVRAIRDDVRGRVICLIERLIKSQ
jgi:protein-tyrosine-phosphatase